MWPLTADTNTVTGSAVTLGWINASHCEVLQPLKVAPVPKQKNRHRSSKQLCPSLKVAASGRSGTQGERGGGCFPPPHRVREKNKPSVTDAWLKIRAYLVVTRSPEPESGTRCRFRHDTPTVLFINEVNHEQISKWTELHAAPSGQLVRVIAEAGGEPLRGLPGSGVPALASTMARLTRMTTHPD